MNNRGIFFASAMNKAHYILFHKPFGVVSQFTSEGSWKSLRDFGPFPANVYPVGRLDATSEGLLLLTDDNRLKHRLTHPKFGHPRTYLVQVEREPSEHSLELLRQGISLRGMRTKPAEVLLLGDEPILSSRPSPIRFRKNIPTFWIELTLREGKNHQVRKMTAAIGHPTLRLVRTRISVLELKGLQPGEHRALKKTEINRLMSALSLSTS